MKRKPATASARKRSAPRPDSRRAIAVGLLVILGLPLVVLLAMKFTNRGPEPHSGREPASAGGSVAQPAGATNAASGARPDERSPALANQGNRLLEAGDFKGAETAYRAALKLAPDDEDLHYNLGIALVRQNRLDEAEAAYREALRLFPDYPEVHNNLGNLLTRQKRLDEAIVHFQAALKQLPNYASAHNNYGIALQRQGKAGDALEQFQQAVQSDTNYWEARFNLGNSAAAVGQEELAIASFNDVLRQRPDFDPARQALQRILSRRPPVLPGDRQ